MKTLFNFGATTGGHLKDEGMEQVLRHAGTWKDQAHRYILYLARTRREFTCDDFPDALRKDVHNPNAIGAAFNRALARGIMISVRHTKSKRAAAHRREICIYKSLMYKG